MLLALAHQDEAVHFVALVILEIVAFKSAVRHCQDTSNLIILWRLNKK